jgi:hypothetical protein
MPVCQSCICGKQSRQVSYQPRQRSSVKLARIHTDLIGPITPPSLGGARFAILFTDDFSRYTWIYFVKHKSETFNTFKDFKALVENQSNTSIKSLHGDNGGEYTSTEFTTFLRTHGIIWEPTVAYTPEQNGVAERKNRTIIEQARTILIETKLPKSLWAEIASTTTYLRNRTFTATHNQTPYALWFGVRPVLSHIRMLGSIAFRRIPREAGRKKLDAVSQKCTLVGFEATNIFRLYDNESQKIIRARDVFFIEPSTSSSTLNDTHLPTNNEFSDTSEDTSTTLSSNIDNSKSSTTSSHEQAPKSQNNNNFSQHQTVDELSQHMHQAWKPERNLRPRARPSSTSDSEDELSKPSNVPPLSKKAFITSVAASNDPETYTQAINTANSSKWIEAMDDEIQSLRENDTWTLVDLPHDRQALGGRWIFKTKLDSTGNIARYKARYVVRGFEQKHGIDYSFTFAPVVKSSSYRLLFALAAEQDLEIEQMDIKTAFLYGLLCETIFVQQPTGFDDGSGRVCKLNRALYGLKQAPRVWYKTLSDFLSSIGFQHIESDFSLFMNAGTKIIIAIYVDDLLIVGPDLDAIRKLKQQFESRFQMTDLGPCRYYLGLEISRSRPERKLHITQSLYLQQVLQRYNSTTLNASKTPMEAGLDLKPADKDHRCTKEDIVYFQSAIGSLLYASTISRPDLAFAVARLGQFASNPDAHHQQALKRIFRYVNGTLDYGLLFSLSPDTHKPPLLGYSDADWAGDKSSRRSTGGYCFFYHGNLISWSTKRQATVALSSCEAEYMALTQATKEAIWLRALLSNLGLDAKGPVEILEDNNSAIALAHDPAFHARVKHIDIQYHFVREKIESAEVDVQHIPSCEMIADCLTKPLPKPLFEKFRDLMTVLPVLKAVT